MGASLGVSNRIAFTAVDCSGRRLTLWATVTFWANDVEAHVTSRNSPTTLRRIAFSTEVSAAILRAQQRPCQAIPLLRKTHARARKQGCDKNANHAARIAGSATLASCC